MLLVSFYTHENNRKLEVLLYFQGVYKASNGKQWVKRKLWKSNSGFSAWILIESYHLLLLVLILVLHLLTQILSLIHYFQVFLSKHYMTKPLTFSVPYLARYICIHINYNYMGKTCTKLQVFSCFGAAAGGKICFMVFLLKILIK